MRMIYPWLRGVLFAATLLSPILGRSANPLPAAPLPDISDFPPSDPPDKRCTSSDRL